MTAETRLAEIIEALREVGLTCLVMGGHAVRFYGLARNTVDFDLHVSPEGWAELPQRLGSSRISSPHGLAEGPSWRPRDFRRFQIGRLTDGREEWLDFWRHNHLLAPFPEEYSRREEGEYGGRKLAFLSLPDLIRSKETERADDWRDIATLEEFLDARMMARASVAGIPGLIDALCQLRSRRGFEAHLERGNLGDPASIRNALARTPLPMAAAYLLPLAPDQDDAAPGVSAIEPAIRDRLRAVAPASGLHLALVEAVRRQYRLLAQARDRAEKNAIRNASSPPDR